jgi:hypothetical protein
MSTYVHRLIEQVLKEVVGQFPAVAATGARQRSEPTPFKFLPEPVNKGLSS